MIDLKDLQNKIFENKIKKGFNTTNVEREFCLIQTELGEAIRAYYKKLPDLGEEVADIFIYLLALAKMLDVDIEKELLNKVAKNERREYKTINGVMTRTKEG
ncbi:MAG: MazG nucleotide pyrophosphohydrolase domain-containing protein [Candidatus Paceibacterota bacterium]|jgi:NTP pyrophosphatase (non-canonical NTP hydrolase)